MSPSTIVNLVLLLFLAFMALGGMTRGFVRGVLNWAVYGVALVVAIQFSSPFGNWIEHKMGADSVIHQYVETRLPQGADRIPMSNSLARVAVQQSGLPVEIQKRLLSNELKKQTLAGAVTEMIRSTLARAIGFVVLLYGVQVVGTLLLAPLVNLIRTILSKRIDALGGLVLGVGTGLLELTGLLISLPLLERVQILNPTWQAALEHSIVLEKVSLLVQPLSNWITHAIG